MKEEQKTTMPSIERLLKGLGGLSPAAVGVGLTRGVSEARLVMWQTREFVRQLDRRATRVVSFWDVVRAFPVEENVEVYGGGWYDGCTSPLERYLLAHLVRYFRPRSLIEVGTFRGGTTRLLLENLPDGSSIYTIDLPLDSGRAFDELPAATDERLIRQRVVGADYQDHPRAGSIHQVFGSTFEPPTWSGVPSGADFAFIDASHSYDAVKNDTERVRTKLADDGVIVWHDYSEGQTDERGVGQYIREQMKDHEDIFLCEATTLAVRIPSRILRQARSRVVQFQGDGVPGTLETVFPWLD